MTRCCVGCCEPGPSTAEFLGPLDLYFGCIMLYATYDTRKLARRDDKLASYSHFITQECCRSAQRPGTCLRALQAIITLNGTYFHAHRSFTLSCDRGDQETQQKGLEPMWRAIATAISAPGARHSAKNQRPGKSRQPRKQLASCTLIPFVTITQTHAAAAGALTPTPVCPAAVCTAPIATCAAHPRPAPKAAKRQLARHAARLSDINTHHGEEYTAKRCAGSHMPRSSGPTWHFGCFATRLRLGDATRCQNRVLRHASFLLRS